MKISQLQWDWYKTQKIVEIYPKNARTLWKTPQCDGCYAILFPTEDVTEWIYFHYAHRAEIIKPFLPETVSANLYDSDSIHVRQKMIEIYINQN